MKIKNYKIKILPKGSPGQVLIVGIIFMGVILILSAALFSRVTSYIHFNSNDITREQATNLAEAGLERTLWKLNTTAGACDASCTTETALGTTGTFEVSITNKSSNLKTITSTGYIPNKANTRAKRTIKTDVTISDTLIAFNFGVQVGNGGVSLGQSARINGSVYSNKTGSSISGNQGSIITGDAFAAGTITSPNPTVQGLKRENQSQSVMPTVDYQYWKDQATNCSGCQTIDCSGTCTPSGSTIGKTKYIGNVSLSQSQILTLTGPVYITGNLDLGQSSKINLDESFGSDSTILILDGTISVGQDASVNPTSANPKGYIMLVTTSNATPAVNIGQSGVYAIIYALNGEVKLGQSSHSTAIIANQLTLNQSAILTYDQGLASTDFTSGPGAGWAIKKGTYRFTQ